MFRHGFQGLWACGLLKAAAQYPSFRALCPENNKLQKLNITNGKVEVSSEVTNNGTGNLDWPYDVVKYSLEELAVRNEEFINAVTGGILDAYKSLYSEILEKYERGEE